MILSTSKPQLKNVTAHDVANSLYYLHLELAGEAPSPQDPGNDDSPRSSLDSEASENRIPRKPLPAGAKVRSSTSPTADSGIASANSQGVDALSLPSQPPSPPPHAQNPSTLAGTGPPPLPGAAETDARRWTGDGTAWYSLEDRPDLPGSRHGGHANAKDMAPVPRKPVAARALMAPSAAAGIGTDDDIPVLPPRPYPPAKQPSPPSHQPSRQRTRSRSPSPLKYHNTTCIPFALQLIRRDPNSGHQWNVGRISSSQLEASLDDEYAYTAFDSASLANLTSRRKTSAPQPDVHVALETSGYAKFRGMPRRQDVGIAQQAVPGPGQGSQTSLVVPSLPALLGAVVGDSTNARRASCESGFHRQVIMTYTKSLTTNLREKLTRVAAEEGSSSRNKRASRQSHSRQHSALSGASTESAVSQEEPSFKTSTSPRAQEIITKPGHGLQPQGYMFMSPWDGACHFRTGNGGRSLKLRHILPHAQSASSVDAVHISELRFNLPGRELFQKGKDEAMARRAELAGHFGKFVRRDDGPGNDFLDEADSDGGGKPSLGIRLGKEKAGGGNRGKRAKLGKLIIAGEGMKMLDLVVAANMGVWWGAWERSF